MRRVLATTVFAAASIALSTSCRTERPPPDAETSAGNSTKPSDRMGQVLARVGDRTITLGDYVAALDHLDEFDRIRYQTPERRRALLAEMIDVMLLADEARERGLDRDPAAEQEVREILRDALLEKAREGGPAPNDVPEDEVRAYYEAHRTDFRDPERRRVSAIVLSEETVAAAVLASALGSSPSRWGELVRAKSNDPGARSDVPLDLAGDFGFVSPPGDERGVNVRVPDPVRDAVFRIDRIGDVFPQVVRAGRAFYIVRLASRSEGHDRTLEDAQRSIRVKLAREKATAREAALLDELRKVYPVQIDEAALSTVRVETDARGDGRVDGPASARDR